MENNNGDLNQKMQITFKYTLIAASAAALGFSLFDSVYSIIRWKNAKDKGKVNPYIIHNARFGAVNHHYLNKKAKKGFMDESMVSDSGVGGTDMSDGIVVKKRGPGGHRVYDESEHFDLMKDDPIP